MKKSLLILFAGAFIITSCQQKLVDDTTITKDEMYQIAKENGNKFSIGIKTKDSALLTNIYSDSAQYVTPSRPIIQGKIEIGKEWASFLRLKENPIDLIINISEVRGNREIIYETGRGYTLLADSTKWEFNYVNVWRLQSDGSYKLEIDTYN
jgi:ketosteroid isomerase-like protein